MLGRSELTPKRLAENRILASQDGHVVGYEETISLDGDAAEEPGIGMVNVDKPQGIIHFDDVLQKSVCLLRNRAVKMCLSDLDIYIPKQIGEKILNHPSIHQPTSPADSKSASSF